jgi:hypothetical protein
VRDAGVGVDPENIGKLLEAFYTTKSDGMGIGLSVSHSIIERHHGRLWGSPTTARVRPSPFPFLPVRQPSMTRGRHDGPMTGKPSLVSVVDDDESVRESLPDLLRQLGFAAEAFASAEAFLSSEILAETSCLLLDIVMPGMSGSDLQEELTRRQREIPIVFITGHGDVCLGPLLLGRGPLRVSSSPSARRRCSMPSEPRFVGPMLVP